MRVSMKVGVPLLWVGGFFSIESSPAALAFGLDSLEWNQLHATDTFFPSNPYAYHSSTLNPDGSTFSFAEHVRSSDLQSAFTTGDEPAEAQTEITNTTRALEFLIGGGDMSFGGGINHSLQEFRTTSSLFGGFEETPLLEVFKRTELRGKVGLGLSRDFRIGGIVRYRILDFDVLGSLNMPLDERTKYSGSVFGVGGSAQFNTESASIAVQYLSPLQGKVELLGESKSTSEGGMLNVCGHIKAFSNSAFGGCYFLPQYAQDELRERTTGPNTDNQTQITVKGVSPEVDVFLHSMFGAGIVFGLSQKGFVRVSGFSETYVELTDPEADFSEFEAEGNEEALYEGYRLRVSGILEANNIYGELGAGYAQRQRTIERNNTTEDLKVTEYNFFGQLGIQF